MANAAIIRDFGIIFSKFSPAKLRYQAVGLKYSTIAAPIDASRNPTYNNGLMADLGGCKTIVSNTLTIGAPPNTNGMT
jgi:hypothetical protein